MPLQPSRRSEDSSSALGSVDTDIKAQLEIAGCLGIRGSFFVIKGEY
jgi:hypothetical protein